MTLQAQFNSQVFTVPGSSSVVNANALVNVQLGYSGIVAILGPCLSGAPKVPVLFSSPGQLKAQLGSGKAYDAARVAFIPSTQIVEGNAVRPQLCYVVRTDTATQSVVTLNDANSVPSITLTSDDYGAQTNNIQVTVAPASPSVGNPNDLAVDMTITYGSIEESYTNVGTTPAFSVYYTGSGTASIQINGTDPSTTQPAVVVTYGSSPTTVYFDYATYSTLSNLIGALNNIAGMFASLGFNTPSTTLVSAIDMVTISTISASSAAPTYFYDVINSIVTTINSISALVTASVASGAILPPSTTTYLSGVYMTGGSTTAPTAADYQAGLVALQNYRVNVVAIADSVDDVSNLGPTFAAWLGTMQGVNECSGHCGTSIIGKTKTFANLQSTVNTINSPNVNFWTDGVLLPNDQGVPTWYDSWMVAALAAGFQAGTPPGTSYVNKSFNILNVQHYIPNSGPDLLDPALNDVQEILARFSFLDFDDASKSWKVVRALTTYTQADNDYYTEAGIRSATNYGVFSIRTDLNHKFLGARTFYTDQNSLVAAVRGEVSAFCKLLEQAQVIVKGSVNQNNTNVVLPSYIIDSVTLNDDILNVNYGLRVIGSVNFIFNTVTLSTVQQSS